MSDKAYLAALHKVDELKRQRDQLREALKACYPLAIVWGAHYQCLHDLEDMHQMHSDAITKASAALAATEEPAQ